MDEKQNNQGGEINPVSPAPEINDAPVTPHPEPVIFQPETTPTPITQPTQVQENAQEVSENQSQVLIPTAGNQNVNDYELENLYKKAKSRDNFVAKMILASLLTSFATWVAVIIGGPVFLIVLLGLGALALLNFLSILLIPYSIMTIISILKIMKAGGKPLLSQVILLLLSVIVTVYTAIFWYIPFITNYFSNH